MTGTEEYGIQSISPRYDENNSYYIYSSEGYRRAVEQIDDEVRGIAEAEIEAETQTRLNSDEIEKLESQNREMEKRILEDIHLREKEREYPSPDVEEYTHDEEISNGSNIDLLA